MKKTLIITLCCIIAVMAACKKDPVEPTPEPVDISELYVGDFLGNLTISVTGTLYDTLGNEIPVTTPMDFPIDNITMQIMEGASDDVLNMSVTIDNETYESPGTATKESAVFERVPLNLDKPGYIINGDIQLIVFPTESDTLNLGGDFKGAGTASLFGATYDLDASGVINGKLTKQ